MFEYVTTIILGVLLAVLPGGTQIDAGRQLQDELSQDRVRVVAEGQRIKGNSASWDLLRVVVKPWETDGGMAGKAVWEFSDVEAVKAKGEWRLESVGGATVTLTFDGEDLGETAAGNQQGAAIAGLWIEKDVVHINGSYRVMFSWVPVEFEASGTIVLEENQVKLGDVRSAKVFRIQMGDVVKDLIQGALGPLVVLEDFDVMLSLAGEFENIIPRGLGFEAVEIETAEDRLVVKCALSPKENKNEKGKQTSAIEEDINK